jgi:hypothetical protein
MGRVRKFAYDLTQYVRGVGAKAAGLLTPYRRRSTGSRLFQNYGLLGVSGALGQALDPFGLGGFLQEIGRFNPLYCEPFLQILMRRSVMPRLGLILLGSALTERQYVIEGSSPAVEAFHQRWVDNLFPQILRRAANAVWFGWCPFVLDWEAQPDGTLIPVRAHDVDPFTTDALEDPETRAFAGLRTDGQEFGRDRSFKLTWEGNLGNPYGEGQVLTVYPHWWAHSVLLVWTMRYYERSVDPVRIAFAKNASIPTGEVDGSGNPIFIDLTELVAEALDVADGGSSVAVPLGEDGENLVKVDQLSYPDRSDTWLKMLTYLEQKQLLATLGLPGIGLATSYGAVSSQDARTSEKMQLRLLEHVSNMPVDELNDYLLPCVHRRNGLPGPCPRARGKAFKREQEESLRELFKAAISQPIPEVGPEGHPTGQIYRPQDLLRFDKVARQLDLPIHDIVEVARNPEDLEKLPPGKGGRPKDPVGPSDTPGGIPTRAENRAAGLEGVSA